MKKLGLLGVFCACALIFTASAQSSALIKVDHRTGKVYVTARLVYSGKPLTKVIADEATREIREMWNTPRTQVKIGNYSYDIEFDVDYVNAADGKLENQTSCAYNFIEVRNKVNPGDRSYYAGIGSQNGVFYTSDNLGHSTTVAHEFGHGLKLGHNNSDQRTAKIPGIMFPRGTLVKPEFQYDSKAKPGAPGGTLNPVYRVVRDVDVKAIPLNSVILKQGIFSRTSIGCLGAGQALLIQ